MSACAAAYSDRVSGGGICDELLQETATYLVGWYGAEMYNVVSQDPRSAHVQLIPSLQCHVVSMRDDHHARAEVPGSSIWDVAGETERKCIEMVRSVMEAEMASV